MAKSNSKLTKGYYEPSDLLPYLADLGLVGFTTGLVVALAGVTFEIVYPGLIFNHISPQRLVVALAAFAAVALLSPRQPRTLWRNLSFGALSFLVAVFVALFAWNYFAALSERLMLTVAAVVVTLIIMFGAWRATNQSEIE